MTSRIRMIVDVSPEVQIAIKLQAARTKQTTGEVVSGLVETALGRRLEEAREAMAEQPRRKVK